MEIASGIFSWKIQKKILLASKKKQVIEAARLIKSAKEYTLLQPCEGAGSIIKHEQVLFNGLRIVLGSYYGADGAAKLVLTGGVNEPEQELLFAHVLEKIKIHQPQKPIMVELGAYWGFYSMWFCKELLGAEAHLTDISPLALEFGKANFKLNNLQANFFVFQSHNDTQTKNCIIPKLRLDDFVIMQNIPKIDLLHCDTDGAELATLQGATVLLTNKKIDYLFISTHSDSLHIACKNLLEQFEYRILKDISLKETHFKDGFLLATIK